MFDSSHLRMVMLTPNAGRQARLKAEAKQTLEAVACTPSVRPST